MSRGRGATSRPSRTGPEDIVKKALLSKRLWLVGGYVLVVLGQTLSVDQTVAWLIGVAGGCLIVAGACRAVQEARPDQPPWWNLVGVAVAAALVFTAIHLPMLDFEEWFAATADAAEKADALAWTRWALVGVAVTILAFDQFRHWVEFAGLLTVGLVSFAAGAGIADLVDSLESTAEATSTEPAYDRGFVIPAVKVEPLARELAQDRCVRIVLVDEFDPNPNEVGNPVRHESSTVEARLIKKLEAGAPSAAVTIDLGSKASASDFATALVAAERIFIGADLAWQMTETSAVESGCPPA